MSKFDDMIDWVTGYTRSVNERRALELKEREVKALEYISNELARGVPYVILPNKIARTLVRTK